MADALATNFICCSRVERELHSDQGRNFVSRFMYEMLKHLEISTARHMPLHSHSYGILEQSVKTVPELLRKVVSINQTDWNKPYRKHDAS